MIGPTLALLIAIGAVKPADISLDKHETYGELAQEVYARGQRGTTKLTIGAGAERLSVDLPKGKARYPCLATKPADSKCDDLWSGGGPMATPLLMSTGTRGKKAGEGVSGLHLFLFVTQTGIYVAGSGAMLAAPDGKPGPTVRNRSGGPDLSGLEQILGSIRRTFPKDREVSLTAPATLASHDLFAVARTAGRVGFDRCYLAAPSPAGLFSD